MIDGPSPRLLLGLPAVLLLACGDDAGGPGRPAGRAALIQYPSCDALEADLERRAREELEMILAGHGQYGGPGGVSIEDLLREMMGGGQGGGAGGGYNQDVAQRSRKRLDDVLGGGTSSGNAADDLLNSVERMTRRR